MKTFLKSIVKTLDWLSCIIPSMLLLEDWDIENTPINPIKYGMSIFGGLIICACAAFGVFLVVGALICIIVSYPIASCSIALVLGLFIGIGYLRKRLKESWNDN